MANRVLRDWTTSEKIDALSLEAEVFFTRLIMKADDHGCFHANSKLLKAALFPLKDISFGMIEIYRHECEQAGIIELYKSEGREYLKIKDFGQRLRNMVSKFPQPADKPLTIVSNKPPETKRNEVKGNESEVNFVDVKIVSKTIALAYSKKYDRDEGGQTGQDIDDLSKELLSVMDRNTIHLQIRNHKLFIGLHQQKPPSKLETIRSALLETDWVAKLKDSQDHEKLQNGLNNEHARRSTRIAAGADLPPANLGTIDN